MILTDLKAIKCKTCGEPLDINLAQNGVIKCAVCDSCFTLPKDTADKKVLDFLSQGEHDLDTGRFDDAYSAFSKACELDKTEPEAYWGMALAEFKIQYLKDEVNNRLQPICHEISDKDFADSANCLRALRYATEAQRVEYERKAEEINYIKNEFNKIANTGVKYDCFICVKVSDENGGRTRDYKAADDIYFELKGKGYKPFFSERELVGVTGADYEARILYALKSSECMLVVCFDEAYLRTKWVKNEHSRFLKLVNDEEKESDSIALVFGDRPIEKLPGKKGKIQGIALNSLTAIERIVQFVDGHTPEAKKRREAQAKKKAQEDDALRLKIAEQEERARQADERARQQAELIRQQEERFKQLEEMLKAQQNAFAAKPAPAQPAATQPVSVSLCNPKDYDISGGVLRKYRGTATQIVIPDEVTSIGRRAFYGHGELSSVTIPYGVTQIGEEAFKDCKGLTGLALPNSVRIIGDGAFYGCSGLTGIEIPEGVTEIADGDVFLGGGGAFGNCKRLTSITVPSTLKRIGQWAFRSCENLKDIFIKNGVAEIGDYAFHGCTNIKQVIIPESVEKMGRGVFYAVNSFAVYCRADSQPAGWNKKWDEISASGRHRAVWDYSDGLSAAEELARQEKNRQERNRRELEEKARKQAALRLARDVFEISRKKAAEEAERIEREKKELAERIRIKAEKAKQEQEREARERAAAEESARLERMRLQEEKERQERQREEQRWAPYGFEIKDGELVKYKGTAKVVSIPNCVTSIGEHAFAWCGNITEINIPDSVTEIGNTSFEFCTALRKVTIPGSVKSIGEHAFYGCSKLTSITLREGVERIGIEAFHGCRFTYIKLPYSITRIDKRAFFYCTQLKSIELSKNVTNIGYGVLSECTGLKSISVAPDNAYYKSVNNCLLTKDGGTLIAGCEDGVIPESVKIIGDFVFSWCKGLKKIVIPGGVTSIGKCAFLGCRGLKDVLIPERVTNIGEVAFGGCKNLKKIIIPEGVTSMGADAFTSDKHIKIYCRAEKQPEGWDEDWNAKEGKYLRKDKTDFPRHKVIWGYKGK